MKITDTFLSEIIDTGMNGEGVCKVDGIPVFVPYAAKGDLCKIKISKVNKNYAAADLVKIVRPSDDRVGAPCPAYGSCGGCCLQHISFDAENAYKKQYLSSILHKSGIDADVRDTVSVRPYHYRNKLQMPFFETDGQIAVGFYKRGTHDGIPLFDCMLHGEWAEKLIKTVTDWANGRLNTAPKTAYDELSGKGLLRHIVARFEDNFLSLTVVVNGKVLPDGNALYGALKKQFDCALYMSENTKKTNVILGGKAKLLFGKEKELNIDGLRLSLSPMSFLQVNDEIRDLLYGGVCDEIKRADYIFDIYSGAGIMTARLSRGLPGAKVFGVEIVKEAVVNADNLATENGLDGRINNICGDAAAVLPDLVQKVIGGEKNSGKLSICVVLDPPRKGCDETVLNAVVTSQADKVIYVSCNPATLCRDLKILENTYRVVSATPYNMFPRTSHVETVVLMSRVDK